MSEFRIEFRSYNVGASGMLGSVGTGFAHNFLVLVEALPNGKARRIAELHGESADPKTGKVIGFDASGRGQLKVNHYIEETQYYRDSDKNPKFVLFRGSEHEVREQFEAARREGRWIDNQKNTYDWRSLNSNAAANTLARAIGKDVTGQPIARDGRHLPAPGASRDLRQGRRGPLERMNGYGEGETWTPKSPSDPEALPHVVPDRSDAMPVVPASSPSYVLGFDNARRFAGAHGFDPRAANLTWEQNKIVSAWVLRELAPDIAHGQLPKPVGDDLLDHAAVTTAHDAGLALQQGLNRLAGATEFGRTPPTFADGAPMRVEEDGWIGPETQGAAERHRAEHGIERLREAVSLAAFRRGLDRLAKGEDSADAAPLVFRRSVGRLYRNPDGEAAGGFAPPRPSWAPASAPRHEEVATLQESLNDANRIFAFADAPLKIDGDLGPKTSAAIFSAARAAGAERLADHVGKRLGIGEPDLFDNRARGFEYALDDARDRER